ncbi:gamma-glutamyltranspeptidase [Mycena sp. CBHHK59/15]|nr:gamma-glutamyltranspeptidase [Mycena sp. CBHHK59/15]
MTLFKLSLLALACTSGVAANADAKGKHGAVVSEVKECSEIGVGVLKKGGAAADAIIATGLCVGVINAFHSGIGGGGFMIVRSPPVKKHAATYETVDFREAMPALGNETMYSNNTNPTASTIGGLGVGVPGELRGWEMLHKRHGKLPWASLFQPAINLAENGYVVPKDLGDALSAASYPFLLTNPLWAETYAPNGTLAVQGDVLYRKRYARTLSLIAKHGADYFYSGALAANTSAAAIAAGGILTPADLANYTAIIRAPRNITYGRARIFSTVAPSSGTCVLSALNVFAPYASATETNETTHLLIQATKFAYGQRTNFGDPAFTANVTDLEALYLEEATAESIREILPHNTTYPAAYYDPSAYQVLSDNGTSHMAAVDQWGGAVSLTTTVNLYWGSRVMTEDGIVLNDEMDDFSSPNVTNSFGFLPSPVNYIRPGKRPQSSISSSIAEDVQTGEILIATGSAGGSRIITATLQNLHNHLDLGKSANASVWTPRWHDQLGATTLFEGFGSAFAAGGAALGMKQFGNGTIGWLAGRGYNVSGEDYTGSTSHVIVRGRDGVFEAANDPRKSAGGGAAY